MKQIPQHTSTFLLSTPAPLLPRAPAPLLPCSPPLLLPRSPALVPVAAFLPRSCVNGPGVRSVLWVQGCPFRCAGCFNPDFQSFAGGQATPVATVVGWILARDDTEGVTFSGGEPFAHAEVLAAVAERVRQAGQSVVIFTGFGQDALLSSHEASHRRLLAAADVLIAGPYERARPSRHPWLSSENQELVFLTGRYVRADLETGRKRLEFRIGPGGQTTVTGFRPTLPPTSGSRMGGEP